MLIGGEPFSNFWQCLPSWSSQNSILPVISGSEKRLAGLLLPLFLPYCLLAKYGSSCDKTAELCPVNRRRGSGGLI